MVHIYRNPIDSVSSYIERDLALKNKFEWNWKKKLKRDFLISKDFHQNFPLNGIEEGYNLWEQYVSKAISLKDTYADYLEIRYEDFLEKPLENLQKLVYFSGLQSTTEQLEKEISSIKSDRAYAFLSNPVYVQIYQQLKNKPLMQQLGYDKL